MREVKRSALVGKPAAELFALINDIESYPQFLPWCTHARVQSRSQQEIVATLGIRRGALHGEFTMPAPGGGYQTLAAQTGQVTSVSTSSIALKSEDGFVRTYSVDDNTLVTAGNNGISDVKTGDAVHVLAVVSGGKARAVDIVDATTVQQSRGRWAPFPRDWPGSP